MIQNICLITLMIIPIIWHIVLTVMTVVKQDAVLMIKSLDVGLILGPVNILVGIPFLSGMTKHLEKIPYVGISIQIIAIVLMYFYVTKWNHIELYLDKKYMDKK